MYDYRHAWIQIIFRLMHTSKKDAPRPNSAIVLLIGLCYKWIKAITIGPIIGTTKPLLAPAAGISFANDSTAMMMFSERSPRRDRQYHYRCIRVEYNYLVCWGWCSSSLVDVTPGGVSSFTRSTRQPCSRSSLVINQLNLRLQLLNSNCSEFM